MRRYPYVNIPHRPDQFLLADMKLKQVFALEFEGKIDWFENFREKLNSRDYGRVKMLENRFSKKFGFFLCRTNSQCLSELYFRHVCPETVSEAILLRTPT